ncbi:MAG: serine hydrolase [Candidatus Moranbacteria bacterium]|nr:serine hydrolase [Candidatus Moranbacteria bacterium]
MRDIIYSPKRYNPKPPKRKPKYGFLLWLFVAIIIVDGYYMLRQYSRSLQNKDESTEQQSAVSPAEAKKPEPIKAQASDNPEYQPVRNDEMSDLVIPTTHAFVVVDADTGKILAGNHEADRRQIASLTKMMTAILTMEKIENLDDPISVGEEEVYIEGTKIGCPRSGYCISPRLRIGEQVSAKNLLQAMLINSANDAAVALGKHISGSQEKFADLMNQKAQQMGLTDTHFCTPSGLEPDGRESECYSSAADIARIAAYSMRYDLIWNMFDYPNNCEITSCDGQTSHTLLNTDVAMSDIPNAMGAKTGFTPAAGYSLLLGASDATKLHRVVVVVLDDPYRWQDIRTAIDWTFKAYSWERK